MENATVALFEILDGSESQVSQFAEVIRTRNIHIALEHMGVLIPSQSYFTAGSPYAPLAPSAEWAELHDRTIKELVAARKASRTLLQEEGLSGEVRITSGECATLGDFAAQHGRMCDLAMLGTSMRDQKQAFQAVLYDLLFRSGAPVLVNPTAKALDPDHVMIAWNSTLQASRAVRLALPMLTAAKTVTIATFDADAERHAEGEDPGADVAKWLSHHGCTVTLQQYSTGGLDVGASILRRATEVGADVVVMGAYAHMRLRETLFGGTTKTMINQTEQPVILAH